MDEKFKREREVAAVKRKFEENKLKKAAEAAEKEKQNQEAKDKLNKETKKKVMFSNLCNLQK